MDMNFIFEWSTRYLTRSLRSLVRYRVDHSKIKFVSTRGHVISSIYQPRIVIFDSNQNKKVALEHKDSVKHLGILIDKSLSWKHHIDHIAIKVSRTVGLITQLLKHILF